MQAQQLPVDGGVQLAVRRYDPAGAPRASIVIGGAMGVRQSFYEPFAHWLAGQGLRVWTFDYRGSGDSLGDAPLRGFQADLFDCARDYEAVIDAAKAALRYAGLKHEDIDWFELNEAFAAQSLAVMNTLGLDPSKVNPMGGAIALGHPLGATGAIRAATVVHALRREKLKYGMVTMCVGMGQGAAGIFERV